MAIFRVNKLNTKGYTIVINNMFQDKELSLEAKGLMGMILTLPKDWEYSINGLASISNQTNNKINKIIRELIDKGYIVRTKLNPNETKSGRFEYIYDIYEEKTRNKKQEVEKQGVEKQDIEKQGVVFVPLNKINNNKINNNKINNNKINNNKVNNNNKEINKEIIEYLNFKAGTRFSANSKTTDKLINARLNENYTLEDFKTVIDKKCMEWLNTDMCKYLRPDTLFGSKFSIYLGQKVRINDAIHNNQSFKEALRKGII